MALAERRLAQPVAATTGKSCGPHSAAAAYLLMYAGLAFSGLTNTGYLPSVKFDLTYVDALAAFCCGVCFLQDRGALRRLKYVRAFVIWASVYFVWAWYVSPEPEPDVPRVLNHLVLIPLIAASVAIAVSNRRRFVTFVDIIQIVAIINAIVCVLQASGPRWVVATARTGAPLTEADVTLIGFRAVGLWANQNQAGRLFVYSLLLSYWSTSRLAWVARIAAVIGCYLTASRFAVYALAFNVVMALIFFVFTERGRLVVRKTVVGMGLLALLTLGVSVLSPPGFSETLVGSYGLANGPITRLARLADLEDAYSRPDESHVTLTRQALDRALTVPWYGAGLYTFQRATEGMLDGAHNMYLMVWGESGIWGLLGYPLLLASGVARVFRQRLSTMERSIVALLWATWLASGFVAHVNLESPMAYVMWSLLYILPATLAVSAADGPIAARVRSVWRGAPAQHGPAVRPNRGPKASVKTEGCAR